MSIFRHCHISPRILLIQLLEQEVTKKKQQPLHPQRSPKTHQAFSSKRLLIRHKRDCYQSVCLLTWFPLRKTTKPAPAAVIPQVNKVPSKAWVTAPYPSIILKPNHALNWEIPLKWLKEFKTFTQNLEQWINFINGYTWNESRSCSPKVFKPFRSALCYLFRL